MCGDNSRAATIKLRYVKLTSDNYSRAASDTRKDGILNSDTREGTSADSALLGI